MERWFKRDGREDGEVEAGPSARPAVEYTLSLAHGLALEDHGSYPWEAELFGHTHDMGWFSTYQVPFERRVRITMLCSQSSPFWFRAAGGSSRFSFSYFPRFLF